MHVLLLLIFAFFSGCVSEYSNSDRSISQQSNAAVISDSEVDADLSIQAKTLFNGQLSLVIGTRLSPSQPELRSTEIQILGSKVEAKRILQQRQFKYALKQGTSLYVLVDSEGSSELHRLALPTLKTTGVLELSRSSFIASSPSSGSVPKSPHLFVFLDSGHWLEVKTSVGKDQSLQIGETYGVGSDPFSKNTPLSFAEDPSSDFVFALIESDVKNIGGSGNRVQLSGWSRFDWSQKFSADLSDLILAQNEGCAPKPTRIQVSDKQEILLYDPKCDRIYKINYKSSGEMFAQSFKIGVKNGTQFEGAPFFYFQKSHVAFFRQELDEAIGLIDAISGEPLSIANTLHSFAPWAFTQLEDSGDGPDSLGSAISLTESSGKLTYMLKRFSIAKRAWEPGAINLQFSNSETPVFLSIFKQSVAR